MSHVATQQITFDIHPEPRTGPATSSPYHWTIASLFSWWRIMSLCRPLIPCQYQNPSTSHGRPRQRYLTHSLLAHLISLLFFLQSQYHSLTLPRKPRKSPGQQSSIWRQNAFLDPTSSLDVNQNHSNRVRLLVQSFESQVFCKVTLYLQQI